MSTSHTPAGGVDVFKITNFRRIDGEIELTIRTDDSASALFLRFLNHAHEFSKVFDYKFSTVVGAEIHQKNRPEKMALAKAARADQLRTYHQLTGTHRERLHILKELRGTKGEDVTIDRIITELTMANKEEKESRIDQVGQLAENGHSMDSISKTLSIPKSTVSRYLKAFHQRAASDEAACAASNLVPWRRPRSTPEDPA